MANWLEDTWARMVSTFYKGNVKWFLCASQIELDWLLTLFLLYNKPHEKVASLALCLVTLHVPCK